LSAAQSLPTGLPGALDGLQVIELCDELGAYAGKLLADMGADVIKIETPEGDPTRRYPPFVDDREDPDRSLYFWHYNTSKRGVTLNLDAEEGRSLFLDLIHSADMLVESTAPGWMAAIGLDWPDLQAINPALIMVSITPFGRSGPRAEEAATDLTLLAGGGPAWSCGYDDHSLPPVRGGGNQGYHTAGHFAVMSALVALLHRDTGGTGQHIDVNAHAASNVTTEAGSYTWLVAQQTVQRQTGRHAGVIPSQPSQIQCADGRWVTSGVPPRRPEAFAAMYEWIEALGLIEEFALAPLLQAGAEREQFNLAELRTDDALREIFGSGREALNFVASRVTAFEFFSGAQERGVQVGIIYSPEEVLEDPHFIERGFPTPVEHPELERTVTYPGAPYKFEKSPWQISRRAPQLGEHNEAVYAAIGVGPNRLARLRDEGVI
jgi:crotonobetainyl-CoA:carnitine CoA-transferase CaiB-like acyl-CoA transferase